MTVIRTDKKNCTWIHKDLWTDKQCLDFHHIFHQYKPFSWERYSNKKGQKGEAIGPWILTQTSEDIAPLWSQGIWIKKNFSEATLWTHGDKTAFFLEDIRSLISGFFLFTQADVIKWVAPPHTWDGRRYHIMNPNGTKGFYGLLTQEEWWTDEKHQKHKARMKHLAFRNF